MNTRSICRIGTVLAFLYSILITPHTSAGGRRRVMAASLPSSALSIAFIDPAAGWLDAGTIIWRGGAKHSTVTTRTVRMRVGDPSTESRGTVTVRAFLETAGASCTIRIDGVPLTTAPQVIRRNAPVGIVFAHRIEIEVPTTAADGSLQASIGWEITTE
jgi:hypothetical protein